MAPDRARSVVIVGGGTAGWLTAGILAARRGDDNLTVTVVESPGVPILGVGEGTWPTIRRTLQTLGVREADFLRACDATFKQGSRFVGWRNGTPAAPHAYTHPFTLPHRFGEVDLAAAWLAQAAPDGAGFDEAVCFQTALCRLALSPKARSSAEYDGLGNYAYHFDAGKVATFLKAHCTEKLGVRYIPDDITGCTQDAEGAITALHTANNGPLEGDFFIDCSGGHGVLIDKVYHVPMVECRDVLFVDRALAIQVPYDSADAPIASVTLATAQAAGWIWDIGLTTRRGVGYVHSSAHASQDEAIATLDAYVRAISGKGLPGTPRSIAINAGYRSRFWVHNCATVGVSSGFVEPLEASSIAMIELSANHLADNLAFERDAMAAEAHRFNTMLDQVWRDAIDFLKLHYALSDRPEPFWAANRASASWPPSLRDKLQIWQHRPPAASDFPHAFQLFGPASYQYVLYGMADRAALAGGTAAAAAELAEVQALTARLTRMLAPHRDSIGAIVAA
ncbi:tryptophan halogenase family protein [Novosphingobium sp. FKTRR1]|uniref:tryptophan halogenase family protein n=1 Tax=Novosphingobium sp. FKTRR1 TaxID=2879118 RepID=UPI001CF0C5BF|nr:tryptophan halogenase family protein [Novosphingobium sp. FKTRR1]